MRFAFFLPIAPALFAAGWGLGNALADWSDTSTSGGFVNAVSAPDADSDGLPNDIDLDDDNDTWSDIAEGIIGTNALEKCGDASWPPDFNNDTFVSGFDLSAIAAFIGEFVPPAPVRRDIAPDPPDGAVTGAAFRPWQFASGRPVRHRQAERGWAGSLAPSLASP